MIRKLIDKGVRIPSPSSVVLEDIRPENIEAGAVIYPGTILRGEQTYIGRESVIGEGGGALIENAQIGDHARIMQGTYRECTLLERTIVRNGAEIREGTLMEEGSELGHTCGLKQTIFFPDIVAGSLINFCDALVSGGSSRKAHSEIGSCMALYNYTPQGDKFASIFGDVEHGVFLREKPVFIGGQTQIVSPVRVGFGAVIAAGSKLNRNVEANTLIATSGHEICRDFDNAVIWNPDYKVDNTRFYIQQLELLKNWYENVRIPVFEAMNQRKLMESALMRIQSGIDERKKRLSKFIDRLQKSLDIHRQNQNEKEIVRHQRALSLASVPIPVQPPWHFKDIVSELIQIMQMGKSYPEAVRLLHE
ncbi:MAG: hypothetical protein IJU23_02710 [Proteobacteria bacterium]|nr:hypothetical protein [Pseudomonadota bacterium]